MTFINKNLNRTTIIGIFLLLFFRCKNQTEEDNKIDDIGFNNYSNLPKINKKVVGSDYNVQEHEDNEKNHALLIEEALKHNVKNQKGELYTKEVLKGFDDKTINELIKNEIEHTNNTLKEKEIKNINEKSNNCKENDNNCKVDNSLINNKIKSENVQNINNQQIIQPNKIPVNQKEKLLGQPLEMKEQNISRNNFEKEKTISPKETQSDIQSISIGQPNNNFDDEQVNEEITNEIKLSDHNNDFNRKENSSTDSVVEGLNKKIKNYNDSDSENNTDYKNSDELMIENKNIDYKKEFENGPIGSNAKKATKLPNETILKVNKVFFPIHNGDEWGGKLLQLKMNEIFIATYQISNNGNYWAYKIDDTTNKNPIDNYMTQGWVDSKSISILPNKSPDEVVQNNSVKLFKNNLNTEDQINDIPPILINNNNNNNYSNNNIDNNDDTNELIPNES